MVLLGLSSNIARPGVSSVFVETDLVHAPHF